MRKKLMKSSTNKMLSGVCAGIAEFFGISPLIVRVLFLLTPGSLLVYFVLTVYLERSPYLY